MRRLSPYLSFSRSYSLAVRVTFAYLVLMIVIMFLLRSYSSASEPSGAVIPEDAIRIRILANSDSEYDQQVKSALRDEVAAAIESWGPMPGTREEARAMIASHLPEIETAAERSLSRWDADYGAQVELAEVPFPQKTFEGREYAAGDYEALRITLGEGKGNNWWCVLFPPLCLTAAVSNEDPQAAEEVSRTDSGNDGGKPQAKFFLWEMFRKLGEFFKSLFS